MYMCMETEGQHWVSSQIAAPLKFGDVFGWPGAVASPWDQPLSVSLALG